MMRSYFWAIGLASALSFAAVASATTCAANTWCFGSNPEQVINGTTYSNSLGSITVFSEEIKNGPGGGTYYSSSNSTIDGLFSTNDSVNVEGIGVAPYNPSEVGGANFSTQQGITDAVDGNSKYGNILLLELGSDIAKGTSLSFLLQSAPKAAGDTVSAYWQDGANPEVSPNTMTEFVTTTAGQITTNGTTPQFSVVKNTSFTEFIAVEANGSDVLLDTITGTSAGSKATTPEPRFYSLLLAGLLGLAGMLYQKRRAARANA